MTIGDLITRSKADEKSKADAAEALRLASTALDDASAAALASDRALGSGLAQTGPVFVVLQDGTAAIYAPDGAGDYHITAAKPVDTTVEG